jgi:hypothetical protein
MSALFIVSGHHARSSYKTSACVYNNARLRLTRLSLARIQGPLPRMYSRFRVAWSVAKVFLA